MNAKRMPAPPQDRHPEQHSTATDSTRANQPEDGYTPGSPDDRREAELLAELAALGYRVAVRCTRCKHPVCDPRSVARHMGPVCAKRAGAA